MAIRTNSINENGIENNVGDISFGDITGVDKNTIGIKPDGMPVEPQIQGTASLYSNDIMNTDGVVPDAYLRDINNRNKLAMQENLSIGDIIDENKLAKYVAQKLLSPIREGAPEPKPYYESDNDAELKKIDQEIEKAFKKSNSSSSNGGNMSGAFKESAPEPKPMKEFVDLIDRKLNSIIESLNSVNSITDSDRRVIRQLENAVNEAAKMKYGAALQQLAAMDESGVYFAEAAKKIAAETSKAKKKLTDAYIRVKKSKGKVCPKCGKTKCECGDSGIKPFSWQ